jgi:hypothetical protein
VQFWPWDNKDSSSKITVMAFRRVSAQLLARHTLSTKGVTLWFCAKTIFCTELFQPPKGKQQRLTRKGGRVFMSERKLVSPIRCANYLKLRSEICPAAEAALAATAGADSRRRPEEETEPLSGRSGTVLKHAGQMRALLSHGRVRLSQKSVASKSSPLRREVTTFLLMQNMPTALNARRARLRRIVSAY